MARYKVSAEFLNAAIREACDRLEGVELLNTKLPDTEVWNKSDLRVVIYYRAHREDIPEAEYVLFLEYSLLKRCAWVRGFESTVQYVVGEFNKRLS